MAFESVLQGTIDIATHTNTSLFDLAAIASLRMYRGRQAPLSADCCGQVLRFLTVQLVVDRINTDTANEVVLFRDPNRRLREVVRSGRFQRCE